MDRSRIMPKIAVAAVLGGLLGAAAYAAGGTRLIINGKTASTGVRTIDGVAYVKVSDVAAALGMAVVKTPDGYEITKAGGAGQVDGAVQGKIGDQLFDGKWRFKVTGADTTSSYALKTPGEPYDSSTTNYNSATRVVTPTAGNTLVVVRCVVANGQKTKQRLWISALDSNTALTDDQGHSYPPAVYDIAGAPIQTDPLLPGARIEFPVIFSVPEGTVLKDLVFTLHNNDSSTKGDEVRVSLKPA